MYKAKKNISPCICRCCLCSIPDGFIKDISAPYFNDGHQEVYADMLKDTFDVEISFLEGCGPSRHSRLICDDCIQKLREASLFKQKVVDSQENILQHLDNLKTREKLNNLAEEPDTREKPKERASQHHTQPTPEDLNTQPLEESEQVENDVNDETYVIADNNKEKGLVEPSDDESTYHYELVEALELEALEDDEFLASVKVELPELDQPEPTRARRRPAVDAALTRAKRVKLEIKDGDGSPAVQDNVLETFSLSPSTSSSIVDVDKISDFWPNEDNRCTKLIELLQSTQEGKGLLHMYQGNGLLSNNGRRKVSNIIIKHILEGDVTKRVSSSTLLDYAQQITSIFKKENISTYFIPYKHNTKSKIHQLPKGKLYDCLQNRKREYRAAYNKTKKRNADQEKSSLNVILPQDQDTSEDITWLKNYSDPFDTVIGKWQNTFKTRRTEILDNPKTTVANYMKRYPSLQKPTGFRLLVDDFKNLYPDSIDKLKEQFPLYKDKILDLTVKKFTRHPDVNTKKFTEECLNIGNQESSSDLVEASLIYAFMYLPLLLGNPLGNTKKTTWRPSKQESRDAFITHLTAATELKGAIAARKEKYAKQGLTFQPAIFIVGPTIKEIDTYYIVVDDTFYVVNSILEAVDVTFKLYHALHCEYPMECKTVYSFLQKAFYKFSTKWDNEFTIVNALLADLDIR